MHLDNSLFFDDGTPDLRKLLAIDEYNTWGGFTASGQQREYRVTVTSGSQVPLRGMLVWSDYPGEAGASPALVNNLDLLVENPSCTQYKGNVFSGGNSATGGGFDGLNVEEGFQRGNPPTGVWSFTVKAANIVESTQPFALSVTGRLDPETAGAGGPFFLTNPAPLPVANEAPIGLPTIGTLNGGYDLTWFSDDDHQQITEVVQGSTRMLEHVWEFTGIDQAVSGCLTLQYEGYRSQGSDNYELLWSKDGSNWTVISGVTFKTFEIDGGTSVTFGTGTSVSGTLYIKIRDTDRTTGDTVSNSVYIDYLQIR